MQEIERVSLTSSKRNPWATHTLTELPLPHDPMCRSCDSGNREQESVGLTPEQQVHVSFNDDVFSRECHKHVPLCTLCIQGPAKLCVCIWWWELWLVHRLWKFEGLQEKCTHVYINLSCSHLGLESGELHTAVGAVHTSP